MGEPAETTVIIFASMFLTDRYNEQLNLDNELLFIKV